MMVRYQTKIISIDPSQPDDEKLIPAVQALQAGDLVAFPTETVYGLGADATSHDAVNKLFQVKGRPSDNPLIVHVVTLDQLEAITESIPLMARQLFEAFSPGPMTLVLKRTSQVPDVVTASLDTVAVRIPAHPVARALIQSAKMAIAAPSANRSGRPSPTQAWHVKQDLDGLIPYIIDGGPSQFGLESTVIDTTGEIPVILRPGSITAEQIYQVTGLVPLTAQQQAEDAFQKTESRNGSIPRAPGMKYRHYAPRATVLIAENPDGTMPGQLIDELANKYLAQNKRVGLFASADTLESLSITWMCVNLDQNEKSDYQAGVRDQNAGLAFVYGSIRDPALAAQHLFDAMRSLDNLSVDVIIAESFPEYGIGAAYMNRLNKAARQEPIVIPAGNAAEVTTGQIFRVLFVCTGNTCRSPMAEALFNERRKSELLHASSAGLVAQNGERATFEAVHVLKDRYGIDLSGHRSKQLTPDMIQQADIVITMTQQQKAMILALFPQQSEKIMTLGEAAGQPDKSVSDPFGEDLITYEQTAQDLDEMTRRLLDRIDPNTAFSQQTNTE